MEKLCHTTHTHTHIRSLSADKQCTANRKGAGTSESSRSLPHTAGIVSGCFSFFGGGFDLILLTAESRWQHKASSHLRRLTGPSGKPACRVDAFADGQKPDCHRRRRKKIDGELVRSSSAPPFWSHCFYEKIHLAVFYRAVIVSGLAGQASLRSTLKATYTPIVGQDGALEVCTFLRVEHGISSPPLPRPPWRPTLCAEILSSPGFSFVLLFSYALLKICWTCVRSRLRNGALSRIANFQEFYKCEKAAQSHIVARRSPRMDPPPHPQPLSAPLPTPSCCSDVCDVYARSRHHHHLHRRRHRRHLQAAATRTQMFSRRFYQLLLQPCCLPCKADRT